MRTTFTARILGAASAWAALCLLVFQAPGPAEAQTCAKRDSKGNCLDAPRPPATAKPPPKAAKCPDGQEINIDTNGHCCWPKQAWGRDGCTGVPACPEPYVARGSTCELPACQAGKERMSDGIHCCWPGQAYRVSDDTCVGPPTCPKGFEARQTECIPDDIDKDGVVNSQDRCANTQEDRDGFQDEDGCPEENDDDGIADRFDSCPNESEDENGFEDDDGCPDQDRLEEAIKKNREERRKLELALEREREQARLAEEEAERERAIQREHERREEAKRLRAPTWFEASGYATLGGTMQYWSTLDGFSGGLAGRIGAGPCVFGFDLMGGNLGPGRTESFHFNGDFGFKVMSAFNWRAHDISFFNLDFGANGNVSLMGEWTVGGGPYVRWEGRFYGFTPAVAYRRFWFADGVEENAVTVSISYGWIREDYDQRLKP